MSRAPATVAVPIYVAAAFSVLHSLATARAAPANFSQRSAVGDEQRLVAIFDRFERWQTVRAILQTLTFIASLVALVAWAAR